MKNFSHSNWQKKFLFIKMPLNGFAAGGKI